METEQENHVCSGGDPEGAALADQTTVLRAGGGERARGRPRRWGVSEKGPVPAPFLRPQLRRVGTDRPLIDLGI